jgi:hypothetical protein
MNFGEGEESYNAIIVRESPESFERDRTPNRRSIQGHE